MIDPFRAVFAYEGAVADGDDVREVAPDILVTPFWTPEFCSTIVAAAEATQAFEPQPDDPVPGHEVSLAVISPLLFEAVQEDIGMRIWPRPRSREAASPLRRCSWCPRCTPTATAWRWPRRWRPGQRGGRCGEAT